MFYLTPKEKLEDVVQSYKHWLLDNSRKDNFKSLLMDRNFSASYGVGKGDLETRKANLIRERWEELYAS